ncbi:Glyoxalase/fosfomycin resistance/dioxygenase domain [Macleaya cordata]|uniref:Glyoxalase/fosfomycin resistance/dioxygenase domain n=1 Tax=Macleaya cordata TaxID=56857 RepID=A0A200PYW7_MACCD|nr:Glyoxalase/fosfomycin resistance/dioxygenase domain [Macleaya cordata]
MAEAEAVVPSDRLLEFLNKDKRRFLHAVYRIGNLDRTIKFYTECFGMQLLRKRDVPEEKYSNALLGFCNEESHFVVELTYNHDHFNVYKMVENIRAKGGNITHEPGPVKGGKSVIAFAKDPDGYVFELIQRGPTPEPLCQVMLRVGDLDRAIKFYEKALGMKLLRTIDNPAYKVAISTDDVYKSAEIVNLVTQELGGKITPQPGPIPGISTKITSFLDPDGWKTVLVDNEDFLKELHKEDSSLSDKWAEQKVSSISSRKGVWFILIKRIFWWIPIKQYVYL